MNKKLYAILDEKARLLGPIMQCQGDDDAKRVVETMLAGMGMDTIMRRYPADFALLCLGSVDVQSGVITLGSEAPWLICKLDEFVAVVGREVEPLPQGLIGDK